MSIIQPTLADPLAPEDAWKQAADRVTPLGEYLGAKLLGGLEATRPGELYGLATTPGRLHGDLSTVIGGATDEFGRQAPGLSDLSGVPSDPLLSKDAYEASPNFRPGLAWDEGMTEARAAAQATTHDRQVYRDSLVARSDTGYLGQAAGFALGFGAAALDPTNYIPLIGPASKTAMVARFGRVGGSLLGHGADAALNTGLFEPLAATTAQVEGRDYGWEQAGGDILTNALGGAVLGTAVGEAARALGFGHDLPKSGGVFGEPEAPGVSGSAGAEPLPTITEPIAPPIVGVPEVGAGVVPRHAGQPPLRVDDLMRRADAVSLAATQLEAGEPVDVGRVLANDPAVRASEPPPGIDAYHGSPHLFDQFSIEKLGTGEGAQAFGHGLYFAEAKGVAEDYKRTLAKEGLFKVDEKPIELDHPAYAQLAILADNPSFDIAGEKKRLEKLVKAGGPFAKKYAAQIDQWDQAAAVAGRLKKNEGALYKVRLAMEHGDLLDWDKPLSEQSPAVREALDSSAVLSPYLEELPDTATGADLYHALAGGMDITPGSRPDLASQMLGSSDIPGIRYLDAGSRDRTEGTRNIVVFDPARIHVLERNGMSLATAAPEPPHPSVAEAAGRVGKGTPELETFKADAKLEGYDKPLPGHEPKPEPGSADAAKAERATSAIPPTPKEKAIASAALPPELQEVEAMRREGTLTPADEATLAAGEKDAQQAEGYATAYETLLNCVLRNA